MRFIIAIFLLAAVSGAALVFALWRDNDPGKLVEADIGDAHFAFAQAYARDEATAAGGISDRLAFAASFPDFTPLAARDPVSSKTGVMITVTPKDDSLDPADRPARLYARFLGGDAWTGPGGLVLRKFEAGSPYDLELLYIAPPDGRGFFARCPKAPSSAVGASCLSVFREGAFDVELRFAPGLLEHWDALTDGAGELLARMTATARRKKPQSKF